MSPVSTVAQVFDAIQGAKAGASAFCTNFFPAQGKLQGWIDHGELLGEVRDRSAFFLRKDRDFWHLYFCAADVATLQREIDVLPGLKTERVAVDLVGSEAVLGDLLKRGGIRGISALCPAAPIGPRKPARAAATFCRWHGGALRRQDGLPGYHQLAGMLL